MRTHSHSFKSFGTMATINSGMSLLGGEGETERLSEKGTEKQPNDWRRKCEDIKGKMKAHLVGLPLDCQLVRRTGLASFLGCVQIRLLRGSAVLC